MRRARLRNAGTIEIDVKFNYAATSARPTGLARRDIGGSFMMPTSVADVRRNAYKKLPRAVFDFVDGGAEDETTMAANRAAFNDVEFRTKILVDASSIDTSTTVFGRKIDLPLILAPTGLQQLVHKDGELATARAAQTTNILLALSSTSSFSLEEVAKAGERPQWFQLYIWRDRDLMRGMIERAAASGYGAMCVTVDVQAVGKRERDVHNGMTLPPRITPRNAFNTLRKPRWLLGKVTGPRMRVGNVSQVPALEGKGTVSHVAFANSLIDPAVTWDDIKEVRELWKGPMVIKGILTAEDARKALDHGCEGVVVSNHGGRQIDGAPGSFRALREVVEAVGGRGEIFLDGGIRRGADIVKARAIGARAVMMGRPYLYGLAAGQSGVEQVIEILREELARTLTLVGAPSMDSVDGSFVQFANARGVGL